MVSYLLWCGRLSSYDRHRGKGGNGAVIAVQIQATPSTAGFRVVPHASHPAIADGGFGRAGIDGVSAITFTTVFNARISISCAVADTVLNSHVITGQSL